MSNNSRHSVKMQKKFDKEQTALRARVGKQIAAPQKQAITDLGVVTEPPNLATERRLMQIVTAGEHR